MITTYDKAHGATASGTNHDTYLPSGGAFINTKGASQVSLITQRTAQGGTATLQAFVEHYYPIGSAATWLPLLDLNNATQVQGVVYADGVFDSSTPFHRYLILMAAGRLTTAADNAVAVNTIHKYYNIWIPEKIRFRFRHGGTAVTNTFSAQAAVHTTK